MLRRARNYGDTMNKTSIGLEESLSDYLASVSSTPSAVQAQLIARTAELGGFAGMQIAPEQGEFLATLVDLLEPMFAVEIGTFTGYSALSIAGALPAGGRLMCCDVSEEWTNIASEHWRQAGVEDRIDLRIAPASETLRSLDTDTVIDFAFIDADKGGYVDYYEQVMAQLAPKGLICVDNTLWGGAVASHDDTSTDTVALRAFNQHVADDPRTRQVIVPIGDGLTLIRRTQIGPTPGTHSD